MADNYGIQCEAVTGFPCPFALLLGSNSLSESAAITSESVNMTWLTSGEPLLDHIWVLIILPLYPYRMEISCFFKWTNQLLRTLNCTMSYYRQLRKPRYVCWEQV